MLRLINYPQFTLCSARENALKLNCVACLIPVSCVVNVEQRSSFGWFLLCVPSSVFELIILSGCAQKRSLV